MQPFDYYRPASYDEAFELLTQPQKTVVPIAGATDLIPLIRDARLRPDAVVDIKGLPGMRDLQLIDTGPCCAGDTAQCLFVGAAVRINELARANLIRGGWPLLAQAAAVVGNEQVRNRATLGGNLCTASPAADTAPALYALDATVLIKGPAGDRCVPVTDFFAGPRKSVLKQGELVTGVMIPRPAGDAVFHHEKLSRRKAGDLAVVSVAVMASPRAGGTIWRVALGAVGPTPIRAPESEAILAAETSAEAIDRAAASAYGCCCPIGDIRSGLDYRQAMVVNLTRRAIRAVIAQLPAAG